MYVCVGGDMWCCDRLMTAITGVSRKETPHVAHVHACWYIVISHMPFGTLLSVTDTAMPGHGVPVSMWFPTSVLHGRGAAMLGMSGVTSSEEVSVYGMHGRPAAQGALRGKAALLCDL